MDYSIFVTPIVGAVIGYSTNWVAIKMLFKPNKEKRIFGLKVPFTPGLIPKERYRIAGAIGEVIEQYLLTDTVIIQELTSEAIQSNISGLIEDELKLGENIIDLSAFLEKNDVAELTEGLSKHIVNSMFEYINSPDVKLKIAGALKAMLQQSLKQKDIKTLYFENEDLIEKITEVIFSGNSIEQLSLFIDSFLDQDKSIRELLGNEMLVQITGLITYHEPDIKETIINIIDSEAFSENVKVMISDVIASKFGALGAMFVSPDSIYSSIVNVVKIKVRETQITDYINQFLQDNAQKQLFELIPEVSKKELTKQIAGKIINSETKKYINDIISNIEITPYEWLENNVGYELELILEQIINKFLEQLYNNEEQIKASLSLGIHSFLESLISKPINITSEIRDKILNKIRQAYVTLIEKYVIKLIKTASLSKVVEKQINTFDVELLEEVILSISKKELSAITWLGALLGLIMSIVILFIK